MCSVKEYIGLWKEQYFTMIRIQFPEFLKNATFFIFTFVSSLPVNKANQRINISNNEVEPTDKIECEVLYDPPPGTHRGDVIIIHGLHGSTYKTWRQGFYDCERVQKIPLRHKAVLSKDSDVQLCDKCIERKTSTNDLTKTIHPYKIDDKNETDNSLNELSEINYKEHLNNAATPGFKQYDSDFICDSNLSISLNQCDRYDFKSCEKGVDNFKEISDGCIQFIEQIHEYERQGNTIRTFHECEYNGSSPANYMNACEEPDIFGKIFENDDYCICNNAKLENRLFWFEQNRLKYQEVYGHGPILITKLLFYFVNFFLNFAKEMYNLYKKLWDMTDELSQEDLSACWPRDWIPLDCPYTRVISINYTTFLWMPIWTKSCNRTSLEEKSIEMARQLEKLGVGKLPVLWAAHSKGGLFAKRIFINSCNETSGVSKDLFMNTNGIVFYSVPQHGSVLAHLFTAPFVKPSIEIVEVRTGSRMVRELHYEFIDALKAAEKIRKSPPAIVSYTETIPTNMNGVLLQIVFPTTADPGVGDLYGIPLDHRMICKFASRNAVLYKDLIEMIETMCGVYSES